jgi:predicted Zn-dependent protease
MSKSCSRRWLAAVSGLVALAGCATPLSVPEERELGAELDRDVRRDELLLRDEVIVGYVDRIGREIVGAAGELPYTFRFQVIADDEINAFAAPAGYVYVNTGTLEKVRNVSELAGVLAHEIGHVARRHVAENYGRERSTSTLQQIGVLAAGAVGGYPAAGLANAGGALAAMAYVNSFGREAERDADAFAVDVLPRAGYDPEGLVTFFATLQRETGDSGLDFLSSHPATSERIADTAARIQAVPRDPDLRVDDAGQLEIIQRRIRLLKSLRRERHGGR